MGVVFLWACKGGVGFWRQLAKTHPSLLVHVTTWWLCQRSWWYTFWPACCISVPTIYIHFVLLAVRPGGRCTYMHTSCTMALCFMLLFPDSHICAIDIFSCYLPQRKNCGLQEWYYWRRKKLWLVAGPNLPLGRWSDVQMVPPQPPSLCTGRA